MTLFGWDASDYDVDRGLTVRRVREARAAGIDFMTYKGTEQSRDGTFHSQYYGVMLTAAKDAGIPFLGMYVVVHSGVSTETQATTAIEYADRNTPWWRDFNGFFWQIDLERWPTDDVPPSVGVDFGREIERRTGKVAIMYASRGEYGSSRLGDFPRWNADYPYTVAENFRRAYERAGGDRGPGWVEYGTPRRLPRIWQYTDSAIIGSQRTTDADAFRGTLDDFAEMIGARAPEGDDDVLASFFGTPRAGQTIDADDEFHTIEWSDDDERLGYRLPAEGIISQQATVDLRGLEEGDIVRLRAEYRRPGSSESDTPLVAQERVSYNPDTTGGVFVVTMPNVNAELPQDAEVRLQVAVRANDNDSRRRLEFGDLTRMSVLVFRRPS
ncbi:hypothetical protein [Melissospora conviva]|uniref:hypothetical protein n=1 Tax=Melissospora conviva TaxID=3388432 RepID=UPI003B82B3CA